MTDTRGLARNLAVLWVSDHREREQLKKVEPAKSKWVAIYPWGAAEGLFFDRHDLRWREGYFETSSPLDPYFER